MIATAFRISLVAVVAAAFLAGGRTERQVGGAYALAAIASEMLRSAVVGRYRHLEMGVFCVDLLLLAALLAASLSSNRRWPLGEHVVATVTR